MMFTVLKDSVNRKAAIERLNMAQSFRQGQPLRKTGKDRGECAIFCV